MIVIKKDEAMESVKTKAWYPPGCDNKDRHIDFLFNGCSEIDLVQCKDCRWYEQKQKNRSYNVSKRYCNRSVVLATKEDDFCSYGERREI